MFSITVLTPAIEQLNEELVLMLDRISKEPPPAREDGREIEMMPELMSMHGDWNADVWSAGIPARNGR